MRIIGKTAAEIFDSVRLLTQSGSLKPGQALPPVRDLAVALEVNHNTVAAAYKRLVTTGIALAQGRLGTVIREPTVLGEQEGTAFDTSLADVASGNPNPAWLPDITTAFARASYRPRLYGELTVASELAAYARQWFAGDCPATDEIELTWGAVDAIERLLAAHLVAGDRVVVEDPCFLSSINTLRTSGLQVLGVAVDAEGMRADALEEALCAGAQAVILTPRAHNPTGCSLSAQRAQSIRAVLERYPHRLVIADDHFALLSVGDYHSPIPVSTQRWALVRSVSKALGPDLRMAFVASDPQTASGLRLRLASGTTWVSHVLQGIVQACLFDAGFGARLAQAREDYARRRDWLVSALADQGLATAGPADGLNVWLPLERESQPVVFALAQRGWLVRSGDGFRVRAMAHGLRLTISNLEKVQAMRLAADIRASLGRG
ncbi:transcriptional regulator PtsJ [Verminephrobacter aporrectodeae subsp. tuberculatae]|uniref:MocR-like B6 salvage transcription factor PtsJ n=1 Tax=Verminephrobacter aporrectodeae TaxID=1110389 RepID=UPI002243133D|nr:transcriptional regulator PtsJ [Verminephrobacter aporrectodeae]MCW8164018.1 transcriptional regulator PtsJ [Verminephrobacter aporrectodeae subsp. tuberculatae]MCW8168716.1 transcriptional regulator PtsJ [Verminephrobacter aporrectodeae subsp. tuberculatae]